MTNAPWYIGNDVIHKDLKLESTENHIQVISRKFVQQITRNNNPTILEQLNFTNNNGKYPFPYVQLNGPSRSSLHNAFCSHLPPTTHREKESEVSLRNLISAPTRHPRELATSIPAAVSNGTPRSPPC
ncbi:hypothetical protein AVEN_162765-1 [Araneus ventricosus]|uniref:Uncharacterized protein n=1 Tax=Araneus ventricosus TaxID=182803 RepID=A0A4Y2T841_ARAVE|nr:hypothetical protein AVEN_162765-1 [Araneus ventricosus]